MDCWSKGAASSSNSAVRGLWEEDGKGGEVVETRVSTMEDEDRVRGSGCETDWRGSGRALGVLSSAPSFTMIGEGEVGVSSRPSRGDSGEKEGKDVRDLSEAAIDEAELEGWDVNLALLLLVARTTVDLWELLDRTDC